MALASPQAPSLLQAQSSQPCNRHQVSNSSFTPDIRSRTAGSPHRHTQSSVRAPPLTPGPGGCRGSVPGRCRSTPRPRTPPCSGPGSRCPRTPSRRRAGTAAAARRAPRRPPAAPPPRPRRCGGEATRVVPSAPLPPGPARRPLSPPAALTRAPRRPPRPAAGTELGPGRPAARRARSTAPTHSAAPGLPPPPPPPPPRSRSTSRSRGHGPAGTAERHRPAPTEPQRPPRPGRACAARGLRACALGSGGNRPRERRGRERAKRNGPFIPGEWFPQPRGTAPSTRRSGTLIPGEWPPQPGERRPHPRENGHLIPGNDTPHSRRTALSPQGTAPSARR